jgi:outer membrane protein assembly factor BamB
MWFLFRRERRPTTARRPSYRPRLEALEDRCVPSLMQVASISPAGGGLITLPSPTVQVTFSEAYAPASVGSTNLTLSQGTVTGFSLTSATTVSYTLGGLKEGPLTVSLAAAAVTAANGDLLQAYSSNYDADIGTEPFPGPLTAANPSGSLIYQGTVSGQFNSQVPPFVPSGSGGIGQPFGIGFGPDGKLYVSGHGSNNVLRYDATTGAFLDVFVPASSELNQAVAVAWGPDANGDGVPELFVSSNETDTVLRYDGATGASLPAPGKTGAAFATGSQLHPVGLAVRNGLLYVASESNNAVWRYNAATGAFVDAFVPSGSGGLSQPNGLAFGPDGNLYVASYASNTVLRYDGTTGAFLSAFVAAGSGGLANPVGLAFGPDGNLYVGGRASNNVLRYDGVTGAFLGTYVAAGAGGLSGPEMMAFGPDGALYVTSWNDNEVLRFDGSNGGPGDVDSFTLDLSANQALALKVTSAVAPTLTVTHSALGPITLGPDLDPGPGLLYQPAQFKDALGNPVAGTVTLRVQAPNGLTVGSYSIQATLNAQFDTAGDGSAPVQSLAPSTLDVDPAAGINRAAVLGRVEKAVARITTATAGVTNDLRGSWDQAGTSTTWNINNGSGVTGSLSKQVPTNTFSFYGQAGDVVNLRTRGSSSGGTLATANITLRDPNGVQASGTQVPGASSDYAIANFTLTATGTYTVTVSTSKGGKGSYTLTASLVTPANPRPNTADVYGISASAGQYLSFAAAVGDQPVSQPQVQLALYAPGVDPLSGTPVATSRSSGVLDAWLDYNATAAGVYEIKVTTGLGLTGSAANYDLVAVANGTFDDSANASFSTAQDLTGRPGSVGSLRHTTSVFVPSGSGGLNYNEDLAFNNGSLYVASRGNNTILRYDAASGAFLGTFASGNGLNQPLGVIFGPDGNLYVGNYGTNSVLRFNGATGAFMGTYVAAGSGGINGIGGSLAFGADGNLYVGDSNSIRRYQGPAGANPGAFIDVFVAPGSGGLSGAGVLFGPDGNLYSSSQFTNQVLEFNGTTGAFMGVFVSTGSGGLTQPLVAAFGPDGNLYVSSYRTNQVLRYQGPSGAQPGAFIDAYIPAGGLLRGPTGLVFGPDGGLYVSSRTTNSVLRTQLAPDFYKVTLSAGQTVTFNTLTPGDGPGVAANVLDPHIQLFDPSQALAATGTKLADGRNETITYTAPAAGTYYVEITAQNFTEGDYVLDPEESGAGATVSAPQAPIFAGAEDAYGHAMIGSPGTNFGSVGVVTQHSGAATMGDHGGGVVIQPDGKSVAAGYGTGPDGTEDFTVARYLPSDPEVGSFNASANPVTSGSSLTLTASNISEGNVNSSVSQVAFDAQVNGSNTLLGYGTQTSSGTWSLTFTVSLPPGTDTLDAQPEDSDGVFSDPDALSLQVT